MKYHLYGVLGVFVIGGAYVWGFWMVVFLTIVKQVGTLFDMILRACRS